MGDDEQYAAFVALAANRLGVPARVVVGARPGPRGWVRGRDVFAWVELRVGDGSWRVLPLSTFMSHRVPRRSEPPRTSPERYVERTTPRATEPPTQRPADGTGTAGTTGPEDDRPGLPWWLLAALGGVGGARAQVAATPTAAAGCRRVSLRFAGGWSELLDLAADQGRPVPSELPRVVQARLLGRGEDLARFADEHVFAPEGPDSAAADVVLARHRPGAAGDGARGGTGAPGARVLEPALAAAPSYARGRLVAPEREHAQV